jgi:hypothetical protein
MEISRVFISEGVVLNFGPLPPIGSPVRVFVAKIDLDKRAKALFKAG